MQSLNVLTERQRVIYEMIRKSVRDRGIPPTRRELGTALGISSPNGVQVHLAALRKKGFLSWAKGTVRGLVVEGERRVTLAEVLAVVGRVAPEQTALMDELSKL